jgi:hypothetical protein
MDHSIINQNNTNRINCYKHHHCCNKCKYVESKIDNKKK